MTKSLVSKIRLKERLYTFSRVEGTPIRKHLDDFTSTTMGLESMEINIEDEDKAILLVISLPPSYKHFKEILLYGNGDAISFEDAKDNLLSKKIFDLQMRSDDKANSLSVRGRSHKKEGTDR